MSNRNNKKNEISSQTDPDSFAKMMEVFEKFTSKILDQMNKNFNKQTELLSTELFELRKQIDLMQGQNTALQEENVKIKKEILTQRVMFEELEQKIDQMEQDKYKDDIVITGDFEIPSVSPITISSFLHKMCPSSSISHASISSFFLSKNKTGQSLLKLTVKDRTEKISVLKSKKELAKKNIFVNEVLTNLRYKLLMTAKRLCREKKLAAAWTRNGKIFIKKTETSPIVQTKNTTHLSNIVDHNIYSD
jgi:hypothetical protein